MSANDTAGTVVPPKVAVLLASYNGAPWIAEQIDSVLCQRGVDVRLFVSDDGSSDDTRDIVDRIAAHDARVSCSTHPAPQGFAAANFFHMLCTLDLAGFDYIAFADQDDIWLPGKLAQQAEQLVLHGADGTSSDVIAFWPDGRTSYLRKSQPQRCYDYIFETPGPGCSMLFTPRVATRLRELLVDAASPARAVGFHDWLVYAVTRASGWQWYIADRPTLMYRQHAGNEVGINRGAAAALRRLHRYLSGAYARQCRALLGVARACAQRRGADLPDLSPLALLLHSRRRGLHRLLISAMFPFGLRSH